MGRNKNQASVFGKLDFVVGQRKMIFLQVGFSVSEMRIRTNWKHQATEEMMMPSNIQVGLQTKTILTKKTKDLHN